MESKLTNRSFAILTSVAVALLLLSFAALNHGWFTQNNPLVEQKAPPESKTEVPEGWVEIGGVVRPASDIVTSDSLKPKERDSAFKHVGTTPLVGPKKNEATKRIFHAIRNAKDLERKKYLSAMAQVDPFDEVAYRADPESYLSEVQPGRVWQNLPAGKGVQPLRRKSEVYQEILQGESVVLRVQASSSAPVSFYSSRLGRFSNGLTAITVAADTDGVAEVVFNSTAGSHGEIPVLAASPLHSRQQRFVVNVVLN